MFSVAIGLGGEVRHNRDLTLSECADFLAIDCNDPNVVALYHRHCQKRPESTAPDSGNNYRLPGATGGLRRHI